MPTPPPSWLQLLCIIVAMFVAAVVLAVALGVILIVCFRGSSALAHDQVEAPKP